MYLGGVIRKCLVWTLKLQLTIWLPKGISPKKQPQWHFRPQLIQKIEQEVNKLIDARIISEIKDLTWIVNIVLVRKKND